MEEISTTPTSLLLLIAKCCLYEEDTGGWCGCNCNCYEHVKQMYKELKEELQQQQQAKSVSSDRIN
jgi:hypothetical protein